MKKKMWHAGEGIVGGEEILKAEARQQNRENGKNSKTLRE